MKIILNCLGCTGFIYTIEEIIIHSMNRKILPFKIKESVLTFPLYLKNGRDIMLQIKGHQPTIQNLEKVAGRDGDQA